MPARAFILAAVSAVALTGPVAAQDAMAPLLRFLERVCIDNALSFAGSEIRKDFDAQGKLLGGRSAQLLVQPGQSCSVTVFPAGAGDALRDGTKDELKALHIKLATKLNGKVTVSRPGTARENYTTIDDDRKYRVGVDLRRKGEVILFLGKRR